MLKYDKHRSTFAVEIPVNHRHKPQACDLPIGSKDSSDATSCLLALCG